MVKLVNNKRKNINFVLKDVAHNQGDIYSFVNNPRFAMLPGISFLSFLVVVEVLVNNKRNNIDFALRCVMNHAMICILRPHI